MEEWRPRLAVLRNTELIGIIIEFANGDDRTIARLSIIGREVWRRQFYWLGEAAFLFHQFISDEYEIAIEEAQSREIRDQLDLSDALAGDHDICACNAVARGWIHRCEACERFEWD